MSIQHKDIADAFLHEPKGVATAGTQQIYIADGAGSGTWRKVRESDIDYTNPSNNVFGWNDIADTQYTSGAPLAVVANTRTKLTNNALGAQTTQTRLGTRWNTSTNNFDINDLNSSYLLRVNMKVTAAAAASTPYVFKIELQSSNGPTVIAAQDLFVKGGGYVNDRSTTFPFYMGSFINNYPLSIFITCDTAINVYNIGFVLQRMYKES